MVGPIKSGSTAPQSLNLPDSGAADTMKQNADKTFGKNLADEIKKSNPNFGNNAHSQEILDDLEAGKLHEAVTEIQDYQQTHPNASSGKVLTHVRYELGEHAKDR